MDHTIFVTSLILIFFSVDEQLGEGRFELRNHICLLISIRYNLIVNNKIICDYLLKFQYIDLV